MNNNRNSYTPSNIAHVFEAPTARQLLTVFKSMGYRPPPKPDPADREIKVGDKVRFASDGPACTVLEINGEEVKVAISEFVKATVLRGSLILADRDN